MQLEDAPDPVRALDAYVERLKQRIATLEMALWQTRVDATKLAEEAIGLFLEYRDVHGCDEEASARGAIREISEGVQAAEEIAANELEASRGSLC